MSAKVYEDSKMDNIRLMQYGEAEELDETDKKILYQLNINARQSIADLSRRTGVSRDVVAYRIKKLVENKVILGFRPVFNPPKLGYPVINSVYFLLQPKSVDQENRFVSHLKARREVISVSSLVGKWEYEAKIIGKDPSDFQKTLKHIRMKFPDLIRDFETMAILEEHKNDDFGGLFFQ
ncbi:MAG: HTH-type transcriptional regulator Ptr1 [Candidatus Woesearchaeota archaeon]|nr:HTH-type transcriptional regulator Ptr1 [Candidatus Woesearchaeota archaeon]